MINEEIKFALSHLEEDKIQKIKDNTRIFIENHNRIDEDPSLTTEEEDELFDKADDAKGEVLETLFGPVFYPFTSQYVDSDHYWDNEELFIEDLYEYYFK